MSVEGDALPLFLITEDLAPTGPVDTAFVGKSVMRSGVNIDAPGCTVQGSPYENGDVIRMELVCGTNAQMLASYAHDGGGMEEWGELLWLGDLDRDQRLDALIREPARYGAGHVLVLYLSTHAEPGALVGEAARNVSPPPA